MGIRGNRAVAQNLLEQVRSAQLHLHAAMAAMDAAVGVASTAGQEGVPWDMGLRVGEEVQQHASRIRAELDGPLAGMEALVDRVEDYVRTLGS